MSLRFRLSARAGGCLQSPGHERSGGSLPSCPCAALRSSGPLKAPPSRPASGVPRFSGGARRPRCRCVRACAAVPVSSCCGAPLPISVSTALMAGFEPRLYTDTQYPAPLAPRPPACRRPPGSSAPDGSRSWRHVMASVHWTPPESPSGRTDGRRRRARLGLRHRVQEPIRAGSPICGRRRTSGIRRPVLGRRRLLGRGLRATGRGCRSERRTRNQSAVRMAHLRR